MKIARIEFEPSNQPLPTAELLDELPFRTGAVFHSSELREAIQTLFSTGRFADLAVDARPEDGGVALRILTQPAYFIGHVAIYGIKVPPNSGQLSGAAKLSLGTPYTEDEQKRAVTSMLNLLRENGFYNARVNAALDYTGKTEQANVFIDITPGERARFERPAISGNPERPIPNIIRATHWKRLYGLLGWQDLTEARLHQGLDNIRRYYQKRNLLRSQVTLTNLNYSDRSNTVKPFIDVEAGPRIAIRIEGARISQSRLRQLVPIFQEQSVDTDLLIEGERNIEQYLQSGGYFGAKASVVTRPQSTSTPETVTYTVDRGDRHKFVHLEITGNHYFPAQTIRERLYEVPAQLPRFPHGRFSNDYLKDDLQAIQNLYASNGFRNAKLTSRFEDDFRGVHNHLGLFIHIDEGPQAFVSSLSIHGVDSRDLQVLHAILASSAGQPFSETSVASDRENLLNYFYNRGYLNASFEYYAEPAAKPNRFNLTYNVNPGSQTFVRNVIVTGLNTTRRKLVFDRIELKKGEPLSLTAETDSQRRLYDLGIFARVNTALQNPDGDEHAKYVLYDIDEARHYALNVGVGAQIARIGGGVTTLDNPAGTTGFAPRLALGITRENLLGLGQSLGLQTAVSTIEQRAALTYFIPQFISYENLNFTTTLLLDNSNDIRTFSAHRREASIQLGQKLSRAATLQYRLVFRNVTQSNVKIDQLLIPLLSQPETVGLAEVSLIQDKRDDPTDAHSGVYTTFDAGYAPSALGSQTDFGRFLVRNSTYHTFRRELVLARSTQFGLITRTGGRAVVPLAERLYSGGSTSLRAFPDFQAGPRDLVTGFPLGGNALFINNTELRFPLYGDNVRGVLFHDAGNVYSSVGDMSFRFRQANLQDFSYMVQNVGFGIRYRTPIGPLRVDLSFSPDAPRFFGLKGTLQQYLDGTATSTVQKINAFQFHISLGQAF
ncbi:MAG: BamA/TamA family outer membrane protein [Acidobacteriota bacterium]|nr:BamA/TamA family outer membrane protein [Acidobacteriota bacterium]